MSERSTISQVVQIGVESTPGTPVSADTQLRSIGITPSPKMQVDQFRPSGQKPRSLAILGKEWSESGIEGKATYDELPYLLSSVLTAGVQSTTGVTGSSWVFDPELSDEDTPLTFTIEHGSSVRADSFSYGIIPEFTLTVNRGECTIGGSMLGRRLSDGITRTADPTLLPLVPVLPSDIDVFSDDTFGGLGGTKLGRCLAMEFTVSGRYGPLWVLDSSQDSWVAHVELEPTLTCSLMLEANAEGMDFLNTVRAGETKWVRLKATGPAIAGGTAVHSMQFDAAVQVIDTAGFSDSDGVYAIGWSFCMVADADLETYLHAEVVNTTTAL